MRYKKGEGSTRRLFIVHHDPHTTSIPVEIDANGAVQAAEHYIALKMHCGVRLTPQTVIKVKRYQPRLYAEYRVEDITEVK